MPLRRSFASAICGKWSVESGKNEARCYARGLRSQNNIRAAWRLPSSTRCRLVSKTTKNTMNTKGEEVFLNNQDTKPQRKGRGLGAFMSWWFKSKILFVLFVSSWFTRTQQQRAF